LVTDELVRAIRSESSLAIQYWWGVGEAAVWAWRKVFGVSQFGTDGSKRLHEITVAKGAAKTRGKRLPSEQVELRRQNALALNLSSHIQPCPNPNGSRPWTREELAMLGSMSDEGLAAKTGRTEGAVRRRRTNLGIATFRDRRTKS
jgi:hypothetical protein